MKNYEVNFSGYADVSTASGTECDYPGVYCVFVGFPPDSVYLLYIGISSKKIGDRISNHQKKECWRTMAKRITGEENTSLYYTTYENRRKKERKEIEAALVFNHQPPCNQEYRKEYPSHFSSVKIKVFCDVPILDVEMHRSHNVFTVESGKTREISGRICDCIARCVLKIPSQ